MLQAFDRVVVCAQPATAGMLPPSDSDEEDSSSEEEEEEKPKLRTPQPAVVSARPCALTLLKSCSCSMLPGGAAHLWQGGGHCEKCQSAF